MGNISLRNILFSVLAKYRLIGWVWTFKFIQDHPLGLVSQTFALGWYGGAWVLLGAHHFFGLGEWDIGPICLSSSVAPQPLCTDCVGKGYNSSYNGCYFHVSAWKRAN